MRALRRMVNQEIRPRPMCAVCNKPMTFVDAVSSPEGAMSIFRCPGCRKLSWEKPTRDQT
ncbi:hypothetical protein C7G41_33435 [Bradyrhizobium sp. MOS002]|nr:hypothetical protein C7G41_33435 [Bradyrhizobium sp. MOS002]